MCEGLHAIIDSVDWRRRFTMIDKSKWKKIYSVPSDKVLSKGIEVFEMATPLKKYINRVENLRIQIVENWCLCKYCQMFDPSNYNFNHWKGELHSYLKDLSGLMLIIMSKVCSHIFVKQKIQMIL